MTILCQKCEKLVEFARVQVSLPPHDPKDVKSVCLDCALGIVEEYNKDRGIATKKILLIQQKPEETDESI